MLAFFSSKGNGKPLDISRKLMEWFSFFLSDKYYGTRVRIWAHVLMWFLLSILYGLMMSSNFTVSASVSILFMIRNILGAMFFFYTAFYFIIPKVLLKGYFFLALLCFCVPFIFWSVINYLCSLYAVLFLEVKDTGLREFLKRVVDAGWQDTFALNHMLKIFLPVVMIIAPPVSLKLILDIIRASTRTLRLERDNLNLEVSFLRSQLNPHFLFNTLNNIYSLSIRNDALASDLIMHLSEMMRYTLYDSNTDKVPLDMEAEFLKNYVELESVRYGKNASISFECDTDQMGALQIAPLLMFPFVENAFKYSHSTTSDHCWIHASMEVADQQLRFEISNSKGVLPEGKKVQGGIGLSNTRKRLILLYPEQHTLFIENNPEYYKVVLTLTLN
ncbi:sensor histidine kinase [Chitinophaga sp. 22321]|uniref:Histidine kinase n=1 Tax=Chitinophaga hostae TaxID=2831022 RepID=A0ABS5IXT3_9BACT|nr:histidine kinase [Chitinophaga hostae]MBS0027591.1 histidine kinase [Chitinophaga hostae]